MATIIMQGDEYPLRFEITADNQPLDISNIEIVEITIGNVVRRYPDNIYYDSATGEFVLTLTQETTFNFTGWQELQVRVKFRNTGWVVGEKMEKIQVKSSNSKEVL